MQRYCLNIHADYGCAHSGACCTAQWPIPADDVLVEAVRGNLIPVTGIAFETLPAPDGSHLSLLATTADGACVFFESEGARLCAVHRAMGPGLLPSACRNFPRIALRDPRGVFVTLSHYCPTAAGLLLNDRDLAIVAAPASLTLDDAVEGLDATAVLPPLLRAGMLVSLDGYTAWEREAVATLNDRRLGPADAVDAIRAATADASDWGPEEGELSERIESAFADARKAAGARRPAGRTEHAIKSFLAAHAFGSWAAYQQGGLHAVARSVQWALHVLDEQLAVAGSASRASDDAFITAVRQTDFLLRHARTDVASGSLSPLRRD